jgi:hypothetical protein
MPVPNFRCLRPGWLHAKPCWIGAAGNQSHMMEGVIWDALLGCGEHKTWLYHDTQGRVLVLPEWARPLAWPLEALARTLRDV